MIETMIILIIKINIKVIMKNMTEIKKIMKMMKLFMNNKIIIQYKIHLNKNIRVIIIIIIEITKTKIIAIIIMIEIIKKIILDIKEIMINSLTIKN
jgi:hypothetical protein